MRMADEVDWSWRHILRGILIMSFTLLLVLATLYWHYMYLYAR